MPAFIFLFVLSVFPAAVFAQDGQASLRLWGQVSPFLSGEAGSGPGAPDYSDAFDTGLGFGGELSWRFSPQFSGLAGLGYERYDGGSHQGIAFDDLEIVPLYVGGKLHLNPKADPWDLYLRLDLGAAHLSSVDVSYGSLKGKYWDASWQPLFDVGAGAEYRQGPWGVSLEVKARYLDAPDEALGKPAKADPSWTLPITLGVDYHF